MAESKEPSPSLVEYFRALRTEIIEAQKLRVQVGLAKTVFLGTLLGFFFKDAKGDPTILICPFVALMFDCMVYGLSFNIRDIGSYIGIHLEPQMPIAEPWQRHRANNADTHRDWGRIAFRVGSYGLSWAVSVASFAQMKPPTGTDLFSGAWIWRFAIILVLALAWSALVYAEFSSKGPANRVIPGLPVKNDSARPKRAIS